MPAPRPLQVNTQRARRRRAAERLHAQLERLAQVAVGAARVARVQAHDLARAAPRRRPRPRRCPGRRRPARARGSRPARSRACCRRPRSPSAGRRRPASRSSLGERLDRLAQLVERRAARRARAITWPSAAVIVSSGPIGAAPCETQGSISTPSSRTPTAPPSTHLVAEEQRRRRRRASRADASPPSTGTPASRSARKRSTASVGNENGSASRIAPAAPSRSGSPVSAPDALLELLDRRRGTASPRRRRATPPRPTPRCRPRPRARRPSTPPAPQPTSVVGRERLVDALERRLGRREVRAGGEHDREVAGARRRAPRAAAAAASIAPARGVGRGREAGADADAQPLTILRARYSAARGAHVIALFGPDRRRQDRGRDRARRAAARRGEDPVAVSADALQVYAGLEILTGAADARRARAARAPAASASVPVDEHVQRRRVRARCAHAEIDGAARRRAAPDRRRRHRPLPARRAGRARPAPAARRRRRARAGRRELAARAAPAALHAELARARRARPRGIDARPTASASSARSSCSTPARAAAAAGGDSQLWTDRHPPPDAARRPGHGPRGALRRASTRASTRWSPPAPREEVRARRRGRAPRPPPARRSASRSCCAGDVEAMKRRTRHYAKRQLTWMRKLPGVSSLDVTGARRRRDVARRAARHDPQP